MKELLRYVEHLYGMNKSGETLGVRVRGDTGKGVIRMGDKKTAVWIRT